MTSIDKITLKNTVRIRFFNLACHHPNRVIGLVKMIHFFGKSLTSTVNVIQ
jgi:hypothetical protein